MNARLVALLAGVSLLLGAGLARAHPLCSSCASKGAVASR